MERHAIRTSRASWCSAARWSALGYWNDPAKTAERFRPVPAQRTELPLTEMAVWSGDTVRRDADGYLYFVGRRDEMIKTSGYRVSPTEVEEVVYASGLVGDAVAVAAPHPALGEGIVLIASPPDSGAVADGEERLLAHCRARMPTYMVPHRIAWLTALPRNPNGKFDRPALAASVRDCFRRPGMTLDAFSQHPSHALVRRRRTASSSSAEGAFPRLRPRPDARRSMSTIARS